MNHAHGLICGAMLVKADLTSQIQATGVDATAYAAKLPGGETAVARLRRRRCAHPALDAREAHITRETKRAVLKQGRS